MLNNSKMYSGMSFFPYVWKVAALIEEKKVTTQFCLDKADDFPSGRVMGKVCRKTQLSYCLNCSWSQWMIFYLSYSNTFIRRQGSQAPGSALDLGGAAPGGRGIVSTAGFGAQTDLCSGFLPVCIGSSLRDECALWGPIYLHSEGSRRVSLLRKSSQLILQSVTRNVLINGDCLI